MKRQQIVDEPNLSKITLGLNAASQSMIESRYRQFDINISATLNALDLSSSQEAIAKANGRLSAPIGLPLLSKHHAFYSKMIYHFMRLLSSTYPTQPTYKTIQQRIKALTIDKHRGDNYLDVIPTQNKNEIAIRIWFQSQNTHPTNLVSRILLLITRPTKSTVTEPILFLQQFGNVDLCILPSHLINATALSQRKEEQKLILASQAEMTIYLHKKDLITISRYLDHGQTLNLSKIKQFGFDDLSTPPTSTKEARGYADPYQQYLNDISHYASFTFNGSLITRPLPETLQLLHLTPHKKAIVASQELKVSRAGCIGNMIYTTLIVGDQSNMIGGHTIGLCNRLNCLPNNTNLILLELIQTGNQTTNWIEKLGRGRLFLEARSRMLSNGIYKTATNRLLFTTFTSSHPKKYWHQIEALSFQAMEMYDRCHALLFYCMHYSQSLRPNLSNNPIRLSQCFIRLSHLINQMKQQDNGKPYYSILNSIFFETIKDYILLFQSDNETRNYQAIHSFNMHMQYQIFFELFPRLQSAWNTNLFPMDIDHVLTTLKRWKFFEHENDKEVFMQFFLNRFSYYINVGLLEGATKLPRRDRNGSFDYLANQLPNLMGNIFNTLIKQYTKSATLECYMTHLRRCYDLSYDTRGIDIAIKSGVCGTDEIGVRAKTNIGFFDVAVTHQDPFFAVSKTTPINLVPGGASEQNGFTDRSSTMTQLTLEHLANPLINLSLIGQILIEQFYLKPFQPNAVDRSNDKKHFEIKNHQIPRVTHGAMHAARVMVYIKILHHFRLIQQDPLAHQFIDFANSQHSTPLTLIHLTQFAALLHDSARLDEGSDHWDQESATNCFDFFIKTFPTINPRLARLIANTIAFKDNEPLFIEAGKGLGFSTEQMTQANYLRQLVHDADCLDIMRVKSTFRTKFLEMKTTVEQTALLNLVTDILKLIHQQQDQYKDCTIEHNDTVLKKVTANFNINYKCNYEWSPNVIQSIIADVDHWPYFTYTYSHEDDKTASSKPS